MSKSNYDQVFSFELTAREIIETFGANSTYSTSSQDSLIAGEHLIWTYNVENPRTGYRVCIAQLEYDEEKETLTDYVVELQTPAGVIYLAWDRISGNAEYARAKQQAHETFIKVCALIGVHVGYQLTVLDEHPLLHLK